MFEEKRDTSSLTERHVQLQEGSRTQSRTALRSMDYEQGQAHLAPDAVVQRSEDAEPETDKEKLLRLVGAFVDSKFGGDSQAAFGAYAKGGTVDKAGVTELLIDEPFFDEPNSLWGFAEASCCFYCTVQDTGHHSVF